MVVIPGLSSPHIPYNDFKSGSCVGISIDAWKKSGIRAMIPTYLACVAGKLGNVYKPNPYLNSMSMSKKDKQISPKKQIKLQMKQAKADLKLKNASPKKQIRMKAKADRKALKLSNAEKKKQAKIQKHLDVAKAKDQAAIKALTVKSVRKYITSLPFIGSKTVSGFSGFLAAATYVSYRAQGFSHYTDILAGATLGASILAAAPYMRSVSRTNATLNSINQELVDVDAAIGSCHTN